MQPASRGDPLTRGLSAVCCGVVFLAVLTASAADSPNILILNSYHQGFQWSDEELAGIVQTLQQKYPNLEPCIEHLDAKRLSRMVHGDTMKALFAKKFAGRGFDLVFAVDNPALEFVFQTRQELFPDVPVVFCGINDYTPEMLTGQKRVTGVAQLLDPAGTLDAILALMPETREVVVIHDYTVSGLATHRELEAVRPRYKERLTFRSLPDQTLTEIQHTVSELREGSVVLILSYTVDATQRVVSHAESATLLRPRCQVPIFAVHELQLGHDIVGGSLMGGRAHGERVAEMALRILAGGNPDTIPVDTRSTAQLMFDYRELERWQVPLSRLPGDSIVINRPESFYTKHRTVILSSASIVVFLSAIILLLMWNNIRLSRARAELWASEQRLRRDEAHFRALAQVLQHPVNTLQEFLDCALAEALQLTRSRLGYIYFYNAEKKQFILNSWSRDVMKECTITDPQTCYELDKTGMWGESVRQGRPIVVNDFQAAHPLKKGYPDGHARLDKFMTIPIFNGKDIVAVVGVANKAADYDETDVDQLRMLMDAVWKVVERKRAEEALGESEDRLRQSEKLTAIGQLAGGIAHDFNNQLTGVMGYADMLSERLEEEPYKRFALAIMASARRAADLTQKLLAFSRKGKYLIVPMDVHQILGEVVSILERSIDKRVRIRQVLKVSHATILGDPNQIQNALLNLAVNARDAMPEGGDLTFETDAITLDEAYCRDHHQEISPGSFLRVTVTDSGCGMTDEVKKHLFEPFFTTKEPGKGTGMGLASVYGTVRNHHGTIQVHSEPGHGTTVRLCLPLAANTVRETEGRYDSVPARGSARILLVDDEETVRMMAPEMLRDLGYSVATCSDGREAADYYRVHWKEIDLVILDMVMPEMGGRDAFIAMRQINPRLRALLSSGYSLNGAAQGILDEGVLGFIGKPYRKAELAEIVKEALARKL
jgi:signal transduction histidine kinase/ABC-type uncharacterized transport system substrate-binding protein/ActR/RegA family two-component response regulator